MISHQVTIQDLTLFSSRQTPKQVTEVLSQLLVEHFPSMLRDKHDVILAFPLRMGQTLEIVHRNSPFVRWAAHETELLWTNPGIVKLLQSPQHSWGFTHHNYADRW